MKTVPIFLPNKSTTMNLPEEFLNNAFSSDKSRNMEFYNEYLQGRLGLLEFDSAVLSGPVLGFDQFWEFDGTLSFMICSTKDIYKYDFDNSRYDILTPLHSDGTISVGTGASNTIVTGTGTGPSGFTLNAKAGDYLKVGTGAPNTGDTWYMVASVDSDTQLTLTTAGPTASGLEYRLRKCFTGATANTWQFVTFQDKNLGDVWIAINGIDTPVRWTGSGQVQALANLPTGFTSARYVSVYKSRLIFLWTVEGGANQPQRERWSEVADCEAWDDLDLLDFLDKGYWITGSIVWNNYHIVFRDGDAMVGRWVGGESIFSYEISSSCFGAWAADSIIATADLIYYYAKDNKFHAWNMINDKIISESILPYTVNLSPGLEQRISGHYIKAKNQIRWFVPYGDPDYHNACITYDKKKDIIHIWEYEKAQSMRCMGEYILTQDLYVDDPVWGELYVDEQDGYWDGRTFLSNAPILVYGGDDGIVRKADIGYTDDGETYNRIFASARLNFGAADLIKRLWRQQVWLKSDVSGSITLNIKKDDNNAYNSKTKTISLINTNRDIIKENITWDLSAENFKLRIKATNHFSLMGFISYLFMKGRTSR